MNETFVALVFVNLTYDRMLITYKENYDDAKASISLMESLGWKCHHIEAPEPSSMSKKDFFTLKFEVRNFNKIPVEVKKQYYDY